VERDVPFTVIRCESFIAESYVPGCFMHRDKFV
jgi:hypothetical protein